MSAPPLRGSQPLIELPSEQLGRLTKNSLESDSRMSSFGSGIEGQCDGGLISKDSSDWRSTDEDSGFMSLLAGLGFGFCGLFGQQQYEWQTPPDIRQAFWQLSPMVSTSIWTLCSTLTSASFLSLWLTFGGSQWGPSQSGPWFSQPSHLQSLPHFLPSLQQSQYFLMHLLLEQVQLWTFEAFLEANSKWWSQWWQNCENDHRFSSRPLISDRFGNVFFRVSGREWEGRPARGFSESSGDCTGISAGGLGRRSLRFIVTIGAATAFSELLFGRGSRSLWSSRCRGLWEIFFFRSFIVPWRCESRLKFSQGIILYYVD